MDGADTCDRAGRVWGCVLVDPLEGTVAVQNPPDASSLKVENDGKQSHHVSMKKKK